MIDYLLIMYVCILVWIVGQLLGLLVLCENSEKLRKSTNKVIYVPILKAILTFKFLEESVNKRDYKIFFNYLFDADKSLILLLILTNLGIASETTLENRKVRPIRRNVLVKLSAITAAAMACFSIQ